MAWVGRMSRLGSRTIGYCLSIALCLLAFANCLFETPDLDNGEIDIAVVYENDLKYLESFETSRDLGGFEEAIKRIEQKWDETGSPYYFDLLLRACDLLSSVDWGDSERQYALEQNYAVLALTKSEQVPLEVEVRLLLHLQNVPSKSACMSEEAWARLRNERAQLWLRAWQRLENAFDEDFDFDDYPDINVMPPLSSGLPAGISPEHITDPELRAEYEATISENEKRIREYNRQDSLRKTRLWFLPKAERYIVKAYSESPLDLKELESYLEMYVADEKARSRILEAVERNAPGQ
jgi:hypothetical protein